MRVFIVHERAPPHDHQRICTYVTRPRAAVAGESRSSERRAADVSSFTDVSSFAANEERDRDMRLGEAGTTREVGRAGSRRRTRKVGGGRGNAV